MLMERLKRARYGALLLGLLLVPLLLIASCSNEPKQVIKFADNQAGGALHLANGTARFILENGYDYPTENISMTTPVFQATLATGDVHIMMEGWQQNMPEWYQTELAAGRIVNLGESYEGGPQFFVIPTWVHEQYGINTVEDILANWELFQDPEDSSKGAFYNCIIGWQCAEINTVKLQAYGLADTFNNISPGSGAALKASLVGQQIKGEPVFGYYWAPTDVMGQYDWHVLEEPAYTAACWAIVTAAAQDPTLRPVDAACAYETLPLDKLAWGGLEDEAPEVVALIGNMHMGLQLISNTLAWAAENEVEDLMVEGALHYLKTNTDLVKTWMPAKNWEKVEAALEGK
jgi:glycine betaine/proline transport system substrate-binding protein